MTTPFLLFVASGIFAAVAAYFFYRNDREIRKLLEHEDSVIHTTDQAKSRLMSVIGSMGDGIIVLDSGFAPWVINDAARRFLGITKEQPGFADITNPFPPKLVLSETIKNALDHTTVVTLHDVVLNGKTFQLMINPVVEKNGTAHTVGVSILLQDISDEKSMEKMKDDFSNMIVHELRSPIVAIKDSAKMMLKDTTLGDADRENMLNLTYTQANKLLGLVNSILDAARIEGNRLILNKTIGDVGAIARDQVELFLSEAKRKNISLVADISTNLPLIFMDNVRITQVINNFLSNSLKYTNEHGVIKLSVSADDAYDKNKEQGHIIVTIADNGIGIPKEKQGNVFSKFGQIVTSKTSDSAQKMSTGLGLYITKGIVEAHGGTISFVSETGKGTTFTITLPVARETEIATSPDPAKGLPPHPVHMASKMVN